MRDYFGCNTHNSSFSENLFLVSDVNAETGSDCMLDSCFSE